MTLPVRYAPLLFGALLSAIMVAIVSAFVVALNHGIDATFLSRWLRSGATTWPVAFPTVLFVAPRVRRVVEALTTPSA